MARAGLVRHQSSLPPALSELLGLASRPGASTSRIFADAVAARLDPEGADAVEPRFARRLASGKLTLVAEEGQ